MRATDIFKNDPQGRQIMEGVKMRELQVDNVMNSCNEFHQPGEIIPVLEGAGRRYHSSQRYNRQHNSQYNNSLNNNSQNNPSDEDNPTVVVNNSQGVVVGGTGVYILQ